MQSSCFFPPAVEGWASALNSLKWDISSIWNSVPSKALYRCWFTRRTSTFVPLFWMEKSSSTLETEQKKNAKGKLSVHLDNRTKKKNAKGKTSNDLLLREKWSQKCSVATIRGQRISVFQQWRGLPDTWWTSDSFSSSYSFFKVKTI